MELIFTYCPRAYSSPLWWSDSGFSSALETPAVSAPSRTSTLRNVTTSQRVSYSLLFHQFSSLSVWERNVILILPETRNELMQWPIEHVCLSCFVVYVWFDGFTVSTWTKNQFYCLRQRTKCHCITASCEARIYKASLSTREIPLSPWLIICSQLCPRNKRPAIEIHQEFHVASPLLSHSSLSL